MNSHYIFDANFFINLHQVHNQPIVGAIARSLENMDDRPHVTELILGEIKSLRYPDRRTVRNDVEDVFEVAHVRTKDIEALESRVGKERSPQHPDLSLMVLANGLGRTGPTVLVSDDFKIHTTQVKHDLNFKVISPSAFLLELSNRVKDSAFRKTYRRLYRQVRRKEMEYMLSRRDTYNVEPKLSWLVDNLLGSGSTTRARGARQTRVVALTDKLNIDLEPVYRYIEGEKVRRSKLIEFDDILPHLEFLKESKGVDEEVRLHIEQGEFKGAIQVVRTASSRLGRKLQETSIQVEVLDSLKLKKIFAHYLAHYNFMLAFLSLSDGEIFFAEEWLDAAGFCALITKDDDDIVKASYIKALIYFSLEDYMEAKEQFQTTERISRILEMPEMEFRAIFGKSITSFLTGDTETAEAAMEDVNHMVEEFGMEATGSLLEFADHLFHFGRAEVAMSVYNEALESALEWGQTDMVKDIERAMRHCDVSLADAGIALDSDLSHLIDQAHDLAEECQEAYYKEIQGIISKGVEQLGPLESVVKDWTPGKDLPDIYRGYMEVVKFVPIKDGKEEPHTLVIGYIPKVGTLGVYIEGTLSRSHLEKFTLRLKDEGVFKVLDAPDQYRRRYGLRGIVGSKGREDTELKQLMSFPLSEVEDL